MATSAPRTREEQLIYVVQRMFKYLERFTTPTGEIKGYFSMVPAAPRSLIGAFAVRINQEIGSQLQDMSLREQVAAVMRMFNDEILQLPPALKAELDEFVERVVLDGKVEIYIKTLHEVLEP